MKTGLLQVSRTVQRSQGVPVFAALTGLTATKPPPKNSSWIVAQVTKESLSEKSARVTIAFALTALLPSA
jgi:hypothetical protein